MKQRSLIGTDTLDKAKVYIQKRIPVATVIRVLDIDKYMHQRTAFDIIKADMDGNHKATRPEWLKPEPIVQQAPENWRLFAGLSSFWVHEDGE